MRQPFTIGGTSVPAGERRLVDLPVSKLSNHTPVTLPVDVMHGERPGPAMFITAAIHGDELDGVEIIRRVRRTLKPEMLGGTLLSVPIVNAYGFIGRSRYLPDRRDLNRSFPGSPNGSLAGRIANLLLTEVVKRCQIGIDLHTAAVHRVNLPQIRCDFKHHPRTRSLSEAFGTKVILESPERSGSLRKAAREMGVDVLVYEGGEGLRFDETAIQAGVDGIAGVMLAIGMLELPDGVEPTRPVAAGEAPLYANASTWVRAPEGGILRTNIRPGAQITAGELIGYIANPYEDADVPVIAPKSGIVIGRTTLPIVNLGDALFHVAWSNDPTPQRGTRAAEARREPIPDEDEIL